MAYPVKTFAQIRNLITQEIRNLTGLTISDDSDAGIRADGTASIVEGLYHHQVYIQKQLFISTADEPFLYIMLMSLVVHVWWYSSFRYSFSNVKYCFNYCCWYKVDRW
jgi:hypothetical protein